VILHALVVILQSLLKHHLKQRAALSLPAVWTRGSVALKTSLLAKGEATGPEAGLPSLFASYYHDLNRS
jgi:hypothetical protein